jgi:hypothetical protein
MELDAASGTETPRRLILSVAPPDAYVPLARAILGRMGYAIISLDDWRERPALAARQPELAIVEDRRLGELADYPFFAASPIILLTQKGVEDSDDRRVIGALARPAGVHELYRLLQQALEDRPRGSLRVATHLPAQLRVRGRDCQGALLSISENGCLVRAPEPMPLGTEIALSFELPHRGRIDTTAQTTYQLRPATGVVFQSTSAAMRSAIRSFVEEHLAAA